jgi:hypothetical protein
VCHPSMAAALALPQQYMCYIYLYIYELYNVLTIWVDLDSLSSQTLSLT